MKTWMKAIPLVAALALAGGALSAPAFADHDDRRKGGKRIERVDHRDHGRERHYGHKKDYKYGHKHGYKEGYREGRRDGRRYDRHHGRYERHHGRHYERHHRHPHRYGYGHKHRHGPHYGPGYGHGHRHYVPYPAFVFRYYHNSDYEAPAERYRAPHVAQPQAIQAVATPVAPTQVADSGDWPETCLMTREYQTEITVGGELVEGYGQACLQPDGSWFRGPAVAAR